MMIFGSLLCLLFAWIVRIFIRGKSRSQRMFYVSPIAVLGVFGLSFFGMIDGDPIGGYYHMERWIDALPAYAIGGVILISVMFFGRNAGTAQASEETESADGQ